MAKIYELKKEQKVLYNRLQQAATEQSAGIIKDVTNFISNIHHNTGRKYAVIGLSGGVDSSLTASLCVSALGKNNVIGVKMPYVGINSNIWYSDMLTSSLLLPAENIIEIPINDAVTATVRNLENAGISVDSLAKGNIMARERMKNLYAIAGIRGGLVVDTCNKTEICMGYFTRYGDGASDYNPVGLLYKTWIWEMAKVVKNIPEKIIQRKPSADLEKGQYDEEDLGISYPALDLMLWLLQERAASRGELVQKYGYTKNVVDMVMDTMNKNRFKSELPPVFRALSLTFKKMYKITGV